MYSKVLEVPFLKWCFGFAPENIFISSKILKKVSGICRGIYFTNDGGKYVTYPGIHVFPIFDLEQGAWFRPINILSPSYDDHQKLCVL